MKVYAFFIISLVCLTAFSCKKNTDQSTNTPDNSPLQLKKRVFRYEENNQIVTYITRYDYDTAGHLLKITDDQTGLPVQAYVYKGEELVSIINYPYNSKPDTLNNPLTILDNGNTMILDFTSQNRTDYPDSVIITYKWSGNQLREAWTYLYFADTDYRHFQKSIVSYDLNDNETETVISDQWQVRALSYDQKKNLFGELSKLNLVFIGWGLPYNSRSKNNPTKVEFPSRPAEEYLWTYNDDGYPLTMQIKGKDYLKLELHYNK